LIAQILKADIGRQISGRRGHRPPTSVGIRKLERLSFHVISKYWQYFLSFLHKALICQTDRQNCDPQDRTSIVASRGKNYYCRLQALFAKEHLSRDLGFYLYLNLLGYIASVSDDTDAIK